MRLCSSHLSNKNVFSVMEWLCSSLCIGRSLEYQSGILRYESKIFKCVKVDCLPNAVGKQPSIPLIYLGRKWTLNFWVIIQHRILEFFPIIGRLYFA